MTDYVCGIKYVSVWDRIRSLKNPSLLLRQKRGCCHGPGPV